MKSSKEHKIRAVLPEIITSVSGLGLSYFLSKTVNEYAAYVALLITAFIDIALISIRSQIRASTQAYLDIKTHDFCDLLYKIKIVKNVDNLQSILKQNEGHAAIQEELKRFTHAIDELTTGRRRIYDANVLYSEQCNLVSNAKRKLYTIHIASQLAELQRWDPEKMDARSDFYKYLYQTFKIVSKVSNLDRRRIFILKYDIDELIAKYTKISVQQRDQLRSNSTSTMSDDQSENRYIIDLYESIRRIVKNQSSMLKFKVRFTTPSSAIGVAISDTIICDSSSAFVFVKPDVLNVYAYVISSDTEIAVREKAFYDLWNLASEFPNK